MLDRIMLELDEMGWDELDSNELKKWLLSLVEAKEEMDYQHFAIDENIHIIADILHIITKH